MQKSAMLVIGALGLLLGPGTTGAQVVEVPTFHVGDATFSDHVQDVDVAAGPDGTFVAIWGEYAYRGNGANNHASTRHFSASGVPLGPPVMADTSGHVYNPDISADGLGGYAAAWTTIGEPYLFFGQLLDAAGAPRGNDFEVGLNLAGWPIASGSLVGRPSGAAFVWQENGFWLRSVDGRGSRRGGDIKVGSGGYQNDVASTSDGGFVTIWSGGQGESTTMGRFFGANGEPRMPAFAVGSAFFGERVIANPLGGIAVAGYRSTPDNASELRVRRFTDEGVSVGDEILVHTGVPNGYLQSDLDFDARGNLYVVWTEWNGVRLEPVRARAFDTDSNPLGAAIDVTDQAGAGEVRTTRLANGAFVNIWYGSSRVSGSIVRLCVPGQAICGDGVAETPCEQCDDGGANSDVAPDACRTTCVRPRCGDGVVDTGEDCDDGNARACDGCSPQCRLEAGYACGDGVRSRACGEECDDGAANSDTTPDACRTSCRLARCGDGTLDAGEACDDGNDVDCDGCSFECKRDADLPDADGNGTADACDVCAAFNAPIGAAVCLPATYPGVTELEQARFVTGHEEFLEVENAATGLGPVFNGTRCAECHSRPTIGGSSDRNVTRIGTTTPDANGFLRFDPLEAHGGPVLQERGLSAATCSVPGEVVPPEATFASRRNTPALFGDGLLEAIADVDIRLFAAKSRKGKDGVTGHYNTVRETGIIGRFGWKAQVSFLHDFAVEAYRDEIGITSPLAMTENLPQGGALACDAEPEPEDDGGDVAAFTDFMALLAPPPVASPPSHDAKRGKGVFKKLKCALCHTDRYRTRFNVAIPALRNRKVLAYTDLLLHDLGPDLADGIVQGSASGSEFRTAPLWGIRYSAPYLHDGRAATLEDAIVAHGGEATAARNRFLLLDAEKRAYLLAFLNAL